MMRTRLLLALALVALVATLTGAGVQRSGSGADAQGVETRTVVLDEGWNLTGWTGPTTPFADAIAEIVAVTQAAAAFDAGPQVFRTWNATAPGFLNTLESLERGEALWVQVSAPIEWLQPVLPEPGALTLERGFNLVTWTGPSGLAPPQTFAAIAPALNAAFAFDKPTETFRSFGPRRLAFLNDLAPVIYGDGFWVLMDVAAGWAQPAASAPAQVAGTDVAATLDIPRGALPPDVAAEDLRIADGSANPAFLPLSGPEPLLVLELEPSGMDFPAPLMLTAQVALPSGDAPFVLLITDDDVEALSIALTFDTDSGLTTLAIPISHFSGLTVAAYGVVDAPPSVADLGNLVVGVPFTVRAPMKRLDFEREWNIAHHSGGRFLTRVRSAEGDDEGWTLLNSPGFIVKTGPLTPAQVRLPRLVAGPGERQLVPEAAFTCTAPGDFGISFEAFVDVKSTRTVTFVDANGQVFPSPSPPVRIQSRSWVASSIIGTCLAPHIEAVAGPPLSGITTYTIVDLPDSDDAVFFWSGTDCGTPSGEETETLLWLHGSTDCSHAGVAHPTTVITLLMTIGDLRLRCTYQGAQTDSGPPCEPIE